MKPMEVEILVAEVDFEGENLRNQMFHILYDGTVKDESSFAVLGGESEAIHERFQALFKTNMPLKRALNLSIDALTAGERDIEPDDLEVAELSIENGRRAFRRIPASEIQELIN